MPLLKPDQTKLSGPEFQALRQALLDTYPATELLDIMIKDQLGREREALAVGNSLDFILFKIIQTADAQGWSRQLLLGAIYGAPESPSLQIIAQKYGLSASVYEQKGGVAVSPQPISQPRLEKTVRAANPMIDPEKFRSQMVSLEAKVCRIEIPEGRGEGTGFLIGSHAVITNYHVIKLLKANAVDPKAVVLRFGYKRTSDGITLYPGTTYHLEDDWEIDTSPPNDAEDVGQDAQPTPDELDYAVLRVAGNPGAEPVGSGDGLAQSPPRGFIPEPQVKPTFSPDAPLFILQHPNAEPLQWAIDTSAIIGEVHDGLRVRYRTNTQPGSSGSPCFNADFDLVALHHLGDPARGPAQFNQGIPISLIMERLRKAGKDLEIGE